MNALYKADNNSLTQYWNSFQDLYLCLKGCSKATVAEVSGHCIAGGAILALSCDYRVITPSVKIGLNESAFGLVPTNWICQLMIDAIGIKEGLRAVAQGKIFSSSSALSLGIVDQVVEPAALEAVVLTLCKSIHAAPGYGATKRQILKPLLDSLLLHKEDDTKAFIASATSQDTQLALGKYIESLGAKKK